MDPASIILIAGLIIATVIIFATLHHKKRSQTQKEGEENRLKFQAVLAHESKSAQQEEPHIDALKDFFSIPSSKTISPSSDSNSFHAIPPEQEERKKKTDPLQLFRNTCKTLQAQGNDFKNTFSSAYEHVRNDLDFEDALGSMLGEQEYLPSDIIDLLKKEGYTLSGMAQFINDHTNVESWKLIPLFLPLSSENKPIKERAIEIITALSNTYNLDNEEERENIAKSLLEIGCSQQETSEILHDEMSVEFGNVITILGIQDSPAIIGDFAKNLDIDIVDSDEYRSLRDDANLDFKMVAKIFRAAEKDAKELLDAENNYNGLSLSDDTDDIIKILTEAGFTKKEIIDGIWKSDFADDDNAGVCVDAFYNADVPIEDIIEAIREHDIDPGNLDEELREEGVNIKVRIKILHTLLFSEPDKSNISSGESPDETAQNLS